MEATYEKLFVTSLEKIAAGSSLRFLAQNDHRNIAVGRFIKWVKSNPERNRRFEEAQAVAAEILMMEATEIADGTSDANGLPSAVDRDKLRIDTRSKLASFWNPKKYGDVKRVEMTTQTITDENINTLTTEELKQHLMRQMGRHSDVVDAEFSHEAEHEAEHEVEASSLDG